jgi:hypothetical protein
MAGRANGCPFLKRTNDYDGRNPVTLSRRHRRLTSRRIPRLNRLALEAGRAMAEHIRLVSDVALLRDDDARGG